MSILIGTVSVLATSLFWSEGMQRLADEAHMRSLENYAKLLDQRLQKKREKKPRPYVVPKSVAELIAASPDEVRERLDGSYTGCPLQEQYGDLIGCLVLNEKICFLERGTAQQQRVECKERCPVYRDAILHV